MPSFRLAWSLIFLVLGSVFPALSAADGLRPIPPAFGSFLHPSAAEFAAVSSFTSTGKIVGTYYFYWYDHTTREHLINGDGSDALTDHPQPAEPFSYRSVPWHRRQLEDMMAAGIDAVFPVFWGAPSEHGEGAELRFSYLGLKPLIDARNELLREGRKPPFIGMFYDTSTLQHNGWHYHADLTTDYGKQWVYATIRDFFSMVPARHWAMMEGRPMVLFYSAAFARKQDPAIFNYISSRFAEEFSGRTPYLVREISWMGKADNVVAWGGALGLKNPGVASLGPGYDHSAVPGRAPLIVKREDGRFYEKNWMRLLRKPSSFVMVETWNEFHEGTDVCESREFGRSYIDATRKFGDMFKKGIIPAWPEGAYSKAQQVAVNLGTTNVESGLSQVDSDDGITESVIIGSHSGRSLSSKDSRSHYMYFIVDDSFKASIPTVMTMEVEYLSADSGDIRLEFDGSDLSAPFSGAYTLCSDTPSLVSDAKPHQATFLMKGARFQNSQNRGADFRLAISTPKVRILSVKLSKP